MKRGLKAETCWRKIYGRTEVSIAIPIKRGLKAKTLNSSARPKRVSIAIPIKRGLKVTLTPLAPLVRGEVTTTIPIKRGLKT